MLRKIVIALFAATAGAAPVDVTLDKIRALLMQDSVQEASATIPCDTDMCEAGAKAAGYTFVDAGHYSTGGCYAYDSGTYKGKAYFSTGSGAPNAALHQKAVACKVVKQCEHPITTEKDCKAAAVAAGYKTSGDANYKFTGKGASYPTKGCYAYPTTSAVHPGEAYFGLCDDGMDKATCDAYMNAKPKAYAGQLRVCGKATAPATTTPAGAPPAGAKAAPGPLFIGSTTTDQDTIVKLYNKVLDGKSFDIPASSNSRTCEGKSFPARSPAADTTCKIRTHDVKTKADGITMTFMATVQRGQSSCDKCFSCVGAMAKTSVYTFEAGAKLEFKYKAVGGGDWFEAVAALINEDTGAVVDVLAKRGGSMTTFDTSSLTAPTAGKFTCAFFAGSYDRTGGTVLGATLELNTINYIAPTAE